MEKIFVKRATKYPIPVAFSFDLFAISVIIYYYLIINFSISICTIIIFSFLFVLLIIMDEHQTLQFIEIYKAEKLLWGANYTDYCNNIKRNALESIANEFNIDVSAIKIKIKILNS